ncbi:MAG: hypothetical protein ACRDRO_04395 [Pseudonocardiaceae bacterium]
MRPPRCAVLSFVEIEAVGPGQGMQCTVCLLHRVSVAKVAAQPPVVSPDSGGAGLVGGAAYQAWGWPVTQHRDQIVLDLHGDVSAIAIPIPLCAELTQILTARHCAPAVLAHPDIPEHHNLLTGEGYGCPLPWPPGVHQLTGALTLPPTTMPRGRSLGDNPRARTPCAVSGNRRIRGPAHRTERPPTW